MSKQSPERAGLPVSTDTQITAVFVVLALVATYATATVTDSLPVQVAVLLGVGVVVPTLCNELRR